MNQKPKLLKCKCSPGGCTHWEVIMEHGPHPTTLKCVTCGEEHAIRIDVPKHDNLHIAEHEA